MKQENEILLKVLSEDLSKKGIPYKIIPEDDSIVFRRNPEGQFRDFYESQYQLNDDSINVCTMLMTKKPDEDESVPVDKAEVHELLRLFHKEHVDGAYAYDLGFLILFEPVPLFQDRVFDASDADKIFQVLEHIESVTRDLEEDLHDVFHRVIYPSSSDPETDTLSS